MHELETPPSAAGRGALAGVALLVALLSVLVAAPAGGIEAADVRPIVDLAIEDIPQDSVRDLTWDIPQSDFSVDDETADGEFSTGEAPQEDLPAGLDLVGLSAFDGGDRLSKGLSARLDSLCIDSGPDAMPGLVCAEGSSSSSFADGVTVAVLDLEATPLVDPSRICEHVIWVADPANPNQFESLPQFPNDPAGGTNTAFGIRSTFGELQPFRLDLTDDGFFIPAATNTVGVLGPVGVTLLVPSEELSPTSPMRGYTFCTDGDYTAADSIADTTTLLTALPAELQVVDQPIATTTTTTEPATTTTTEPTTTLAETPETTSETGEDPRSPWLAVVIVGVALTAIGILIAARRRGCEEELAAWRAAQKRCDAARATLDDARKRLADAEATVDGVRENIERTCDRMPPVCWEGAPGDSWVEDPNVPGSRIDRFDLFVGRAWAKENWSRYRSGDMTAEQLEDAWGEDPPEDFSNDLRKEYEQAKAEKSKLDDALEDAEREVEAAEAAVAKAEPAADEACREADRARAIYEACMKRPAPPSGATDGGGAGGEPGSTPGTAPPPDGPGSPCSPDGAKKDGTSTTLRVNIPVELRPVISGGHAHAATEHAAEITGLLGQAETGAKALGRLFTFGGAASLSTTFTATGAADLAVGGASEASGIPIPTNIPTAVANVGEVMIKAARVSIGKVVDLQARRLPDVDLSLTLMKATYTMTCTKLLECRGGEWVEIGTRLDIERGDPRSFGTKRLNALTWAEAQDAIADFARRRFEGDLRRALEKMARFRDECAGGG